MCYVLDADVVLANYLYHRPKEELTARKLGTLTDKIHANFRGPLYVEITDNAIVSAVKRYWNLFDWNERNINNVLRAKGSDRYFTKEYIDSINLDVPADVLGALIQACKE